MSVSKLILSMLVGLLSTSLWANQIVLTSKNSIKFDQQFDESSALKISLQVSALNQALPAGEPIYIVLYTPGGSVQAGLELIDFIDSIRQTGRPVHTISMFAASMGFQLLQGLGDRLVTRSGVLMSHQASGGFRGEFGPNKSQVRSRLSLWEERVKRLDEVTVARTNGKQTLESYQRDYLTEYWCEGQTCVDAGYADKVVSPICDASLNGTETVNETVQTMFGPLNVTYTRAKCGLIQGMMDVKIKQSNGMELSSDIKVREIPELKFLFQTKEDLHSVLR